MTENTKWPWEEDYEDELDLRSLKESTTEESNTSNSNTSKTEDDTTDISILPEYEYDEYEDEMDLSHISNNKEDEVDLGYEDEINLGEGDNIPWEIEPSTWGEKKIAKKLAPKKKRTSTLTEEQRFGHKGIPLSAEEVGVFHDNIQHTGKQQSIGEGLHNLLDIEADEDTQESYKAEIDKKIESLGQLRVLNDKSKHVMLDDSTSVADLIKRKRKNRKKDVIAEVKKNKLLEYYDNPDYAKSFKRYQEESQRKIKKYSQSTAREGTQKKGEYLRSLRSGNSYLSLLKTLNVTQDELLELLSNTNKLLSKKEKERLLTLGINQPIYTEPVRKKNGNKVRGMRRPVLTLGDYILMDFLLRFSHSGLKTISIALNKDFLTVSRQLNKLKKMACIKEQVVLGTKTIYYLSQVGYIMLMGEKPRNPLRSIGEVSISNKAITNYIGAMIYSNKYNILDLPDYPQKHRYFRDNYYEGETIIPEYFYRSSLGVIASDKKRTPKGENMTARLKTVGRNETNRLWLEWENKGKEGPSPECFVGNEFMYILYPMRITDPTVIPDMVIKRDRNPDGSPENIAVEVERRIRKKEYYINRLRVYQQDDRIYKEVVYIVNEKRLAKTLIEARDFLGFDRLRIVAMKDIEGKVLPPIKDVWKFI